MRIIKCDFCGAEIEDGKNIVPSDNGWTELSGVKLCERWRKDVCPRCMPKEVKTNRD